MDVRRVAYCAVAVALLIAVQYALSFVAGVELVTVILLCFCYVFGVRCGLLTATAFSLLRCFIFGFYPAVIALYLIYFNIFALIFGLAGKHKTAVWLPPVLLLLIAVPCAVFATVGVPVSAVYQRRVKVMLWILFCISAAILIFYTVSATLKRGGGELAAVTALAVYCTVCFTLLDDIITPLFYGFTPDAAAAYFYAGFLSMLPQTVCAAVSVAALFIPLKKLFSNFGGEKKRRL